MSDKGFLLSLGERSGEKPETDELLKEKISERKRRQLVRQDQMDEATHDTRMKKLEKEAKVAEADIEKADKKEESPGGFKVTGGINMGTIDIQAQQEAMRSELTQLKKEADESARATGQENAALREKIHAKELEHNSKTMELQIAFSNQRMEQLIAANANRKTFMEEYESAVQMTKNLGLNTPQGSSDSMVHIELKKMDFEHQMALRTMSREDKRSDRDFQLKLKELDDKRERDKAELLQQRERDKFFQSVPEMAGRAFAQGLVDSNSGRGGGIQEEPRPKRAKTHLQVGHGEGGSTECPDCQSEIAVGPTARQAVCSGCGLTMPIKRVADDGSRTREEE